ncbi:hypothetical protein SAZ_32615 [Streptomyces noursei ZPM]|nr:hypothetical protein SAZ_32615 [Streptomyces noursei ZPM]EOT05916.1 hypothetical protein K530_01162 [Streptomyces noursei CCRC 11814]EXU92675.1 hypothetical protein P354_15190 [Streptomyces noursei PD-1]
MLTMRRRSILLRADDERDRWLHELGGKPTSCRCALAAYAAFCSEYHSLYSQFAVVVSGSTSVGHRLARVFLEELASQWLAALRSASPSGFAWALLAEAVAPHRTGSVRNLYQRLGATEAGALLLRYRIGCSVTVASRAMGMSPDAFELLRRRALMNAVHDWHMPASDAV